MKMDVRILKVAAERLVPAIILNGKEVELPSMHTGWKFSFDKHSKHLPNAETYVLVTEETPDTIEGCLIFQMQGKVVPYMAFVEVAPHNRDDPKRYDYVAGCLIAFAFKQSVLKGKGDYKAQLLFDVGEESESDSEKLIDLYRKKYKALRLGGNRLAIMDEAGFELIEQYLERKADK